MEAGSAPYGLIPDGAMVVRAGMIQWVGPRIALPDSFKSLPSRDLEGKTITPGLIDCHTHLVYGGNRAREFEMRLGGMDYSAIAQSGGGIVSTMKATREAGEDELTRAALPRLDALLASGVCAVEIKSGYGLSIPDELKMLRVARSLARLRDVQVITTWLAAHAVPPEYTGQADLYIDQVAIPGLNAAYEEGLVDAVDGFCENIAFSTSQIARVFEAAGKLNLHVKLHAEQLSNLGGAKLAASFGALSADHLEYLDADGAQAMAQAGTVAVLLPGAYYTLNETTTPPVQALRDAGVSMAVATDGNPGSSPMFSVLLAMNMACTLFGLTPEEALRGTTIHAARALGLHSERGTLKIGNRADFVVWDIQHPAELAYTIGFNPLISRYVGGRPC